jgi:hypothetical protein
MLRGVLEERQKIETSEEALAGGFDGEMIRRRELLNLTNTYQTRMDIRHGE